MLLDKEAEIKKVETIVSTFSKCVLFESPAVPQHNAIGRQQDLAFMLSTRHDRDKNNYQSLVTTTSVRTCTLVFTWKTWVFFSPLSPDKTNLIFEPSW
jgi:hypothetical protein